MVKWLKSTVYALICSISSTSAVGEGSDGVYRWHEFDTVLVQRERILEVDSFEVAIIHKKNIQPAVKQLIVYLVKTKWL